MDEGDAGTRKNQEGTREKLEGVLERIIYQNEKNGYTVARLEVPGREKPVSITGNLTAINAGEKLRCEGTWTRHPKFGLQFKVDTFETVAPGTRQGMIKYLASGRVKGIGPKLAEALVDHFGDETLEIIDQTPERLLEVSGFGKARLEEIQRSWTTQRGIREIMVFLQGYGLGASHSARIYRQYGQDSMRLVKENPYRLSQDIFGIGFKTADRIALNLGVDRGAPFRIRATIQHLLEHASSEGHLCLPYPEVIRRAGGFLDIDEQRLKEEVENLCRENLLIMEKRSGPLSSIEEGAEFMVFTPACHEAERSVHRHLTRLLANDRLNLSINISRAVDWAENEAGITLEESQREAIAAALEEPVLVITGGPGVGKTTIIRCIARILTKKRFQLALAAPTGRAAKRLAEATGSEATTIHRLLRFNPHTWRFERDESSPLDCDVLIADECSMIDVPLMDRLARALKPDARLVLVGDADQLPSVGPGALLQALIDSKSFRVVRLTKLFRQEEGGGITRTAHEVNAGRVPRFTPQGEHGETYFFEQADPGKAAQEVVELVKNRIPKRFGLDPMTDIQVMTPMHKGAAGTGSLNLKLQEALNPSGEEISRYGRLFRVGDKVMQIRNNYSLNVFNGDIGYVERIDQEGGCLTVRLDDQVVRYNFENLDELIHAYCVSVHKSQGSEFPAVVMPLLTQHYILLRRNLLYTGITRARKVLVVVGSSRAVQIAVENSETHTRYSLLAERFRSGEQNGFLSI